ncbi:enoyl-CoA hydratase-related protein [Paraconexibacter sp. AEG42_29]|uniref:enoyl-CoA hydratase/isomerase family protein n=1 Tax=Paraconexibacter sp. AEG42_29 TaxID=2997339 RepID=UPI00339D8179
MSAPVQLTVDDGVARLTLDGPITQDWADAFAACATSLTGREDVRVVVLGGTGRFFCPGGDLGSMDEDVESAVRHLAQTLHVGLLALRRLDAPSVARVHATAAGAGLSVVLACDVAIAARSASFTTAYSAVGLSPDGGATWLLPRRVGWPAATELLMSSRRVGADEAAALGLVARAVDDGELDAEVQALVATLAAGPTRAYGEIRRLLDRSATSSFADQLDAEATAIGRSAASPTGQAGIGAFLEKRRPDFAGL